ncbi:MAG: tape measure protein [Candidatus Copromonas sp.]|uniref:tape measure protein n=1 Tax=Pilosibacter fragilis TaxID=3078042 RepID=UPI00284DAB44|nr:tape measure protein [Candidatus Copromonas sp.]
MGKIQENLVLTDEFTAAFTRFLTLGESAVGATERINNSINMMGQSANTIAAAGFNTLDQKITELSGKIQEQGAALQALGDTANSISGKGFDQMTAAIKEGNSALIDTIENQSRLGRETQKTNDQASKLLSTIKRIAAAAGVTTLVRSFLDFSDTQAQINARLNLMNDGFQTTNELSEMIYQSALRSKAAYSDTADAVGKMGLNAGNAFSSNQELIAFTEQVNKQFKIGGASAQEQSNAMVQLTQAMAAGVLRGQDLNSILAAAPGIARTIEESMGWASGSIKQYAEDGKVTAQVVKNALLDMADQTNQKFESIPMTLSDAMTQAQNIVQHEVKQMAQSWNDFIQTDQGQEVLGEAISLLSVMAQVGTDALSGIGSAALFVADNMDMILPILAAVGLGFLLVKAQAVQAALGSAAAAGIHMASWAVANWPILLLVALFAGALIAAQQFGIGMQEVGGWVGQVFGMTYAVGYNVFATLWNVIASFAEFFANVFNDPVAAIAHLFSNALDTILSMVETAAGAIDALTGSHLQGAVSGFRGKLSGWVDDTFGENAIQIKRMANLDIGATAAEWGNYGANLGSKLDNLDLDIGKLAGSFNDLDLSGGNNIDKVAKVGKVGKVDDIKLSDEDLKIYRDLAERRYMNKIELKTLAPEINVSIPESAGGNLTADDVTDYIRKMLIEQMNSQTSVSHG